MVVAVATMLLLLVTTFALINFPWSDMPGTPSSAAARQNRGTVDGPRSRTSEMTMHFVLDSPGASPINRHRQGTPRTAMAALSNGDGRACREGRQTTTKENLHENSI